MDIDINENININNNNNINKNINNIFNNTIISKTGEKVRKQ